jgi:predicted RNase H-like HicB family nuclease
MEQRAYVVSATWDDEAKVWVAESNDVPGLVTEAPTLEALQAKIRVLVPELLELNRQGRTFNS